MPPRFRRGRGKAPMTGHDHEAGPSHRRTPSITMSTSPQEPWRTYVEPGRRSVSLSSSPSYLHSFGPQSENEPNNPQASFIPLQRSNSHHSFGDPTPAFQSRFNPANYIQEPVSFNPLEPEDHFSGGNDMDEDTDPVEPATGTPNHPIEISDGSSFHGSPYRGPDSYKARFNQIEWYFTPSEHSSPYQAAATTSGSFSGFSICGSHSATTTTSTASAFGTTEAKKIKRADVHARRSPHQHSSAVEWQPLSATPRRRRPADGGTIKPHLGGKLCACGATIGF
ncbi:hypothetical protein HanHA300_Chr09g0318171 [Helianthus annuus]|nr:hypothetical protein HanHA300_Chr09g0318171 [Helianthus annuus]KAJ0542384.1 hypothetical protein HanHA89_Chr09g0339151 [Helianthus annuus]